MLEKEYQFLAYAARIMSHDRVFSAKDIPIEDLHMIRALCRNGLLEKIGGGLWRIPKHAYEQLKARQEIDERRAKEAAEKHEWEQAQAKKNLQHDIVVALVGAAVTGILTLLIALLTK